jgi:2-amino-4-hydroxy-6-hydroxymethyldihydropteridine diphosphokinase
LPERAFVSIGSNIEPEKHLPLAIPRLMDVGMLIAVSQVYQNPAVGPTGQPGFLNAAALVETELPPLDVRSLLRAIEKDLGRVRTDDKYAPRTIDLDLCIYGQLIIDTCELTLPDPEILGRAHLAVPFAELAPGYRHPVTMETLREIADRLLPGSELRLRPDVHLGFEA